jgi:hypothetical protein
VARDVPQYDPPKGFLLSDQTHHGSAMPWDARNVRPFPEPAHRLLAPVVDFGESRARIKRTAGVAKWQTHGT